MLSSTVRDIAIIIIAVQTIVIGALIAVLVWQIWRLVKIIQVEVMPIIEDTRATVNTVRGTTTFVSSNVVEPVIQTNRNVTKWRATGMALMRELGLGRSKPRSKTGPPAVPPSGTPTVTTTSPNTPPPVAPSGSSSEPL